MKRFIWKLVKWGYILGFFHPYSPILSVTWSCRHGGAACVFWFVFYKVLYEIWMNVLRYHVVILYRRQFSWAWLRIVEREAVEQLTAIMLHSVKFWLVSWIDNSPCVSGQYTWELYLKGCNLVACCTEITISLSDLILARTFLWLSCFMNSICWIHRNGLHS